MTVMSNSETAGTFDFVYEGIIEDRQNASTREAINAAQGSISNPISRDILPDIDFDATGETEFTGDEPMFVQTPADAVDPGDSVIVYEIDSDTGKMDDRVLAVYGFEVVEGGDFVDVVQFRGSDGQVFERAHIQGLDSEGDTAVDRQAVLRSPVLFRPQDNGEIEFVFGDGWDATDNEDDEIRIKLLGVTVEKRGRRIGNRS